MALTASDAVTSLKRLQNKVKRAQSLSARWSETLANSLSSVDGLRKRLEQEARTSLQTGQNGSVHKVGGLTQDDWVAQLSENLDDVCENLESCFDKVGTLQNALDDAMDISEGLDAQVATVAQQLALSRQEVSQLKGVLESNHYKELLEAGDTGGTGSPQTSSIQQLKEVVAVLQAQLHSAQELLADRQREVMLLERRISSQSEATVAAGGSRGMAEADDEGEGGVSAKAVVEVLQTQIRAAHEQLAEKDTEVKRLERRLSSIPSHRTSGWSNSVNFASFTGPAELCDTEDHRDLASRVDDSDSEEQQLSPVAMLQASKEVLQSQFAAAKEVLAAKDAEIDALRGDKARLQAQVQVLQQRLSNVQVAMLQQQLDTVDAL